ncbi:hypothetical protein [Coralliovum pocilloporae]|uniref:hypothetical protein n=1 Tax=Coralliovum pocilloporae TaxID=3066369 RepID=UPI0033076DC1
MTTETPDTKHLAARDSFHGKAMTEARFEMTNAMAGMLEREIRKSGSFYNLRIDLTTALARNENIDQPKAEAMIADVFKARTGVTMKQMRDGLIEREKHLADTIGDQALQQAYASLNMIKDAETMPRYRATDIAAVTLAQENSITELGAKRFMSVAYEQAEGKEFHEAGKEVEDAYHKPVREARIAARKQTALENRQQHQPTR